MTLRNPALDKIEDEIHTRVEELFFQASTLEAKAALKTEIAKLVDSLQERNGIKYKIGICL